MPSKSIYSFSYTANALQVAVGYTDKMFGSSSPTCLYANFEQGSGGSEGSMATRFLSYDFSVP